MLVQTALNAVDLTKLTSSSGPSVTVLQASPRPLPAQRAQQNNINAQQAAYGQPPQSQPGRQGCPGAGSPNAEANAKISSRADDLVFGTIIVVSISAPQVLGIGAISQPAQQMSEIFLDAIRLIIAAGVLIAALIGKFITNNLGRNVLRCLAIALFRAIVLRYMGLADSIINLAFRVGHDDPVGGPEGSDPVTACQLTTWHEERAGRGIAPGPHLPRSPIC